MPNSQFAQPFRIVKNELITQSFFLLEGYSEWNQKLKFQPGQYLMVDATINDTYLRRSYSPFITENKTTGLLINRNFGGTFSSFLSSIKKGQILRISAPTGKDKSCSESVKNVVLLAFESGISFGLNLLTLHEFKFPITTFWQSDGLEHAEFEIIRNRFYKEEKIHCISTVFQLAEILRNGNYQDTVFYLSGNGQKISFFEKFLRSLGINNENIFKEIYFNHKTEPIQDWFDFVNLKNGK